MKKHHFICTIAVLLAMVANVQAQEERNKSLINSYLHGWEYNIKAGFNIGGTSPIPLPKEIRKIDSYAPGIAIAIRRSDEEPWSLCIVRWIRTETPEQIELGLQVIGNAAKPVSVGFRNAEQLRPMRHALVLPPVAALGRQQAILAPAGTYTSRRFALVSDLDRLYIAQGRLLSLDMQTANIELFQFEIDPYPI